MSYRVIEVKRTPALPVAAVLAKRQAEALVVWLRDCLVNGYDPETGEARPRKGDGKPLGYDTGKLARGLRAVSAGATRASARYRVTVSPDRAMLEEARPELGGLSFIEKHNIITTQGRAAEPIAEATEDYMRSLRK